MNPNLSDSGNNAYVSYTVSDKRSGREKAWKKINIDEHFVISNNTNFMRKYS